MIFTVRLLWTVFPHFRQSVVALVLATGFGVWTVSAVPRDVGAPYALLFFCQLFAASSGFRPTANAGYLDPALVRGVTRRQLAWCHWALSSGPGALAWLIVSGVEVWSLGSNVAVGGDLTSLVGLMVVSSIAWVVTLPAARFLGGIGWLFAMGVLASSAWGRDLVNGIVEGSPPTRLLDGASDVAVVVAVPFLFLVPSARAVAGHPVVLLVAACLSLAALGLGVHWIAARDFPGEG